MYKLFFIARNNIKKQKGDMITFLLFTMLATYLVFQCMSALLGLGRILDRRFEEINGAHIIAFSGDTPEEREAWTKAFTEHPDIVDFETVPATNVYAEYRNTKDTEFNEYSFYIEPYTTNARMMRMGLDTKDLKEDDIFLPFYLKGTFPIGDKIDLRFGENVYTLNVAGYAEDPYFSSSVNITVYYCYASREMLDRITEENPKHAEWGTICRGIIDAEALKNGLETMTTEKELSEAYLKNIAPATDPEQDYSIKMIINWHTMRGGAEFLPQVVMGVVLAFGVLTMVIAFIIIAHGVRNFIVRNMKNTGILEAAGYTASMLRNALVTQIVLMAGIGAMIGVGLGILTHKSFGTVVSSVLGLSWNQPIRWDAAVATIVGLILVTFLLAMWIGRSYKRITVLEALRGGIHTHNYKKNHISLDRTKLPLSVAKALKNTLGGARHSLLLLFISGVLAITMACGFGMYESFGAKPEAMIRIMGMEIGDLCVANADISIAEDCSAMEHVTNVLLQKGFEPVISFEDRERSAYTYAVDAVDHRVNLTILKGRVPVHDNEIMITQALAEDLGVNIGDVVVVKMGEKSEEYIVTGFDQRMERMGRTMNMTIPAAEKLIGKINRMNVVLTSDNSVKYEDLEAKVKEIIEAHEDKVCVITNSEKITQTTIGTVASAMKLVCIIIAVTTLLIVIFTEALIIRAKITREWRDMGISRAMGATTGQLVSEIMLSNMPAMILGSILGVLFSNFVGGALCKGIFSMFGMKKVAFSTPYYWRAFSVAGIVTVAVITAALIGLRVRKLKPVEMITEE